MLILAVDLILDTHVRMTRYDEDSVMLYNITTGCLIIPLKVNSRPRQHDSSLLSSPLLSLFYPPLSSPLLFPPLSSLLSSPLLSSSLSSPPSSLLSSSVVAFSVAYQQNSQLIGERGLLPCRAYLQSVKAYVGGKIGPAALAYTPSLLWFMDWSSMDANLAGLALLGLLLSGFVLLSGTANMVIMGTLWVLYQSLVSVGQLW